MIATIAVHQIQALRRQRVVAVFLVVVAAMTVIAGVIGWSSHRTIVRVYDEAVTILAANGKAAPPNPFELKPTLSLLSNMAIYIPLIGALLAIIVGHLTVAADQATGIGRLIFSRRVSRHDYTAGKLVGVASVLAAGVLLSWILSVAAVWVANGALPRLGDLGRLTVFYGLSWLYLLLFALVGMVAVLATRRRSLALLSALGIWLVVTFAIPQFTSGLRPTTSLNPIADPVGTSQAFFRVTAKLLWVSISEQYKTASAHVLHTATGDSATDTLVRVLPMFALVVVLAVGTAWLISRHDYSRSTSND